MKKKIFTISSFIIFFSFLLYCSEKTIYLTTSGTDRPIEISSFFSNNSDSIFLYSQRESRIFKFSPDGKFEKSFCQQGQGPGEIQRVLFMFHNPSNDCLYLPEYFSVQKRVTILDSNGSYKGNMKIDLPPQLMDKIWNLAFLEDGSFYITLRDRFGWEPIGKGLYVTQNKISVKYFNKGGEFISDIFSITMRNEMSNGPNWGGPRILYLPSVSVNLIKENVLIAKNDENTLSIFNKKGEKINDISLPISREKLSKNEFNEKKEEMIDFIKDARIKYLVQKMIKVDYKPIFTNLFTDEDFIILVKNSNTNETGYMIESELIYVDWDGKELRRDKIPGYVMNVQDKKLYIKSYDDIGNENFKITPVLMQLKTIK